MDHAAAAAVCAVDLLPWHLHRATRRIKSTTTRCERSVSAPYVAHTRMVCHPHGRTSHIERPATDPRRD